MSKELLLPVYLKNKTAVQGLDHYESCEIKDPVSLAVQADHSGADGILLFDLSDGDKEHEEAIGIIKEITKAVDIPVYAGGNIHRMEDVKKLLYAGCRKAFLNYSKQENRQLTEEVSSKFGPDKILACVAADDEYQAAESRCTKLSGTVMLGDCAQKIRFAEEGFEDSLKKIPLLYSADLSEAEKILKRSDASGLALHTFRDPAFDFMNWKHTLKDTGISMNTYESSVSWDELKKNSDNMIPVVVQDYKTSEVLMVAYMNQESFETTIRTGRMTYWSRSRNELWIKGLTSGHFQYVKELRIDCDNDTILAKVLQIGAACHTGSRSCFYQTILKREYDETNPLKVFEDVFAVIEDRKIHPKEGSYTNYLFDKGIDKILKKVGEEATEIVIAAKNPDPEEIKYEISDFLYHVMVLMAERGVTWEDITKELARR